MSAIEASRGRAIEARRSQAALALVQVAALGAVIGFAIGAALAWFASSRDDRQLAATWTRGQIVAHLNPAALLRPAQPPAPAGWNAPEAETPEHVAAMKLATRMGVAGGVVAAVLGTGLAILLRRQWISAAREAALDQVKRGSRVATAHQVAALIAKTCQPSDHPITIGGVGLPSGYENRNFLLAGATGSGKTTALHALVHQGEQRGEAAIIFDPDQSYTQRFYRPERGDVILDPWDARTARWNPLADVADLADAERLATILVPKPKTMTENAVWYNEARRVVAHIAHHLVRTGQADLDRFATMLASADQDTLRRIVANTPAARTFEANAERATASVLFMMAGAASTVALLAAVPAAAPAFSFDQFFTTLDHRDGPKPFVFLRAPRRYRASAEPAITAWVDAAASAILQRQPGRPSNAWLFLDELPSLPPINSLLALLPEGRKHGACTVLAFQSIAQIRQVYGEDGAQVLTGQAATRLLMTAGYHATAKWAVDLCGMAEVESQRPTESLDTDAKSERGSLATSRDRKTTLLDSEVMDLKTGEAFLRLSGYPVARVTIAPLPATPPIAEAFIRARLTPSMAIVAEPATAPAGRIEDRDDWLSMGGID